MHDQSDLYQLNTRLMSQGQAEDQVGVAEVRDVHAKGSQPNQLSKCLIVASG